MAGAHKNHQPKTGDAVGSVLAVSVAGQAAYIPIADLPSGTVLFTDPAIETLTEAADFFQLTEC